MKVDNATLDQDGRILVDSAFHQLVGASFISIPVEHSHFTAASDLASRSNGLRAGDALHLAIAASQDATLCTLDVGMARAAEGLGLCVSAI